MQSLLRDLFVVFETPNGTQFFDLFADGPKAFGPRSAMQLCRPEKTRVDKRGTDVMVRVKEVREGAENAMLTVPLEGTLVWESRVAAARVEQKAMLPRQLNLSGSDVLFGFACAIAFTGLLLWAVVKLWLFGQ